MRIIAMAFCLVLMCADLVDAQEKSFRLAVPDELSETGLLAYVLPRFSLKTGIRITVVSADAEANAILGRSGTPVFKSGDEVWHCASDGGVHTTAFLDWLESDVGKRAIDAFQVDGVALFSSDVSVAEVEEVVVLDGDAGEGAKLAMHHCGRCHVVSEANRMNAIGSTPSFALLRTFEDWDYRFQAFFALKPHPAFTQVAEITEPFPEDVPSPIVPVGITLDDLDAILAFVATIAPADLGAPLQSQ